MKKHTTLTILAAVLLFIVSCSRTGVDAVQKGINVQEAKNWLMKSGDKYKTGKIQIPLAGGNTVNGTLNWNSATTQTWRGETFLRIPFVFENNKELIFDKASNRNLIFSIVLKNKSHQDFEGALSVVVQGESNENTKMVEFYELLNGKQANSWATEKDGNLHAVNRTQLTEQQYLKIKQQEQEFKLQMLKETAIRKALFCWIEREVTYSGNCNYSVGEEVFVRLCERTTYITKCQDFNSEIDPFDPNQKGGGGFPPYVPEDPEEPKEPEDPCAKARALADSINKLFNQPSILAQMNNLNRTDTTESGFGIYEKLKVDPFDNTKISTDSYYAGEVQTQGLTNHITITTEVDYLTALTATAHLHPQEGYGAQSAKDIYEVITRGLVNDNSGFNFIKNRFQGDFVAAADGNTYFVKVTDVAAANAFLNTKNSNLEGAGWNKQSEIGKEYYKAYIFYSNTDLKYDNYAYENAMSVVLSSFNTGVTLFKKDAATNSFQPIIRAKEEKKGFLGLKKYVYKDPCNDKK